MQLENFLEGADLPVAVRQAISANSGAVARRNSPRTKNQCEGSSIGAVPRKSTNSENDDEEETVEATCSEERCVTLSVTRKVYTRQLQVKIIIKTNEMMLN